MNVQNASENRAFVQALREKLLGEGLGSLREFADSAGQLGRALETMTDWGKQNISRQSERMSRQLKRFEPSVTIIGQIKSGKTSLVNALIGAPDLLPTDVNPWTSVVTSLHLRACR